MATTEERTAGARTQTRAEERREFLPPHAVVLHNDDLNTFEFVIETLRRVFGYDLARARALTLRAHTDGRAAVWTGAKEHAEFKADQVRSRGADPVMRSRGALPLRVTMEALPQ
jgi:ATP-dependent Clp protease adaptor protein ClpS